MLERLLSKFRRNKIYSITSSFFEIGKTYKVKEDFENFDFKFVQNELLECTGNYLNWHDGYYEISFQNNKGDFKCISIIQECLIYDSYRRRADSDLEAELQSYEKYFERLT